MYTYCIVIIKLHFTDKENKLICLHFEVSIFSSTAPDCQNSMEYMHTIDPTLK